MTAQIIILPIVPKPPSPTDEPDWVRGFRFMCELNGREHKHLTTADIERTLKPAPTLSPRHRRRLKALAAEWGVSQETAVVIMVRAFIDGDGDK